MAIRSVRTTRPQGSKAINLNTGHSKEGNRVGLRSTDCGQGRGMAANATLAFPIEVPDCLIPFLKPKAQKSGKRF